jgi:F420-non-reducing hydrogenase iron-sulfur subunit
VIEEMMASLNLEKERYALIWCSSAEADRFVKAVTEMTDRLKILGPSPFNTRVEAMAAGEGGA